MASSTSAAGADLTAKNKPESRGPKNIIKKFLKYTLYGILGLIVLVSVFNVIWKMSGSGEWELEIDRDGVQVYSMKVPGDSVIKFKGVVHSNTTYQQTLAIFNDESLADDCGRWVAGCVEYKFLEKWNPELLFNIQYWRFSLFFPFSDREMVLKGSVVQDKETKELFLENTAVPNTIPENSCCVRISHLHNTWRYIPQESGGVKVEFIQDLSMGGFFPDFLLSFGAEEIYKILGADIPEVLGDKTDEYESRNFDSIIEY